MAIKIGANLAYNGKLPNFERDSFETKAAMKAFDENSVNEGHLSYCEEDGNIYQYKHTNTVDATTGRWRLFKTDIVVDAELNGTSTNPIQNKTAFDALMLKGDAAALAAYQPKYNADYVAASDFDYSELPNDIDTIDLNGYTMTVSVDNTIVHGYCYNGSINVTSNQVTLGRSCNNVSIYSEDEAFCKNGEGVTFTNCNLVQITIDADCECENSHISSCVIKSFYVIKSSLLGGCTFVVPYDDEGNIVNSVIDGVLYHKCAIKNNKPIEIGYESNIASPSVSGNAPSCEAVKTALQLKADKTQLNDLATKTELNSKADASALNNYVTTATANTTYAKKSDITNIYKFKGTKTNYADLPTTDRVTGDVWNITNADAEHGIKAGDNVAWNGTEWDNLSGVVDLSAYATKNSVAKKVDIRGISSFNSAEEGKQQIQRIVTINIPNNRYQTGFLGLTLMCRAGKFVHVLITINNDNIPGIVNVVETSIVSYVNEPLYYVHDEANSKVMLYYKMDAYDTITAKVTDKDANMNFTWEIDFTPVDALPEGAIQVHNINRNKKNLFYSTPKDTAGNPTFRAIDITDLPDLSSKYSTKADIATINGSIADVRASLESTQIDFVDLRNKVKAMPKTVFITQAAYNALTTKDPNTIYYING